MSRSYPSGITIAPDAFIDLQTHTVLSDGKWKPEALIDYFVREGFATAAITDHDRVDTLAHIQRIAHERAFPLIVGAEMTTRWRNSVVDILCFGFENDPTPLQELCDAIYHNQKDTSLQVYENLARNGYFPHHDAEELRAILDSTTSKQPHMLFDLFVKYNPHLSADLGPMNDAGYKLCTNPTAAVVDAVHRCGGVALIGHPGRSDGFALFDADSLDQFRAEIPIDGIEVCYPRHSGEQVTFFQAYANEHEWLVSVGSDSHTPDNPPIKYHADQCTALLARLDIVVA